MTAIELPKGPWVFGADATRHKGVMVGGAKLTVEEAISQGGLDWEVEGRDAQTADSDEIPADGYKQVVRPIMRKVAAEDEAGNKLTKDAVGWQTSGTVKTRYRIVQNRAAFTFFDNATLEGAAIMRAVGHMDFGRVVWALAERGDYECEVYPGDIIREHLCLYTSHDGRSSVTVRFLPYRISTNSVVAVGFGKTRKRNEIRIRHTKSAEERLATVHNLLVADENYWKKWRATLVGDPETGQDGLKQRLVTDDEVEKVVAALFPAKKKKDPETGEVFEELSTKAVNARAMIRQRVEQQTEHAKKCYEQAGQEPPTGTTALDVFLGVTEFTTNDRKTRKDGNAFIANTFGSSADMRQKAFDVLCGL